MAMLIGQVREWLDSMGDDERRLLWIDEGGLRLCADEPADPEWDGESASIEIGGEPEPFEEDEN